MRSAHQTKEAIYRKCFHSSLDGFATRSSVATCASNRRTSVLAFFFFTSSIGDLSSKLILHSAISLARQTGSCGPELVGLQHQIPRPSSLARQLFSNPNIARPTSGAGARLARRTMRSPRWAAGKLANAVSRESSSSVRRVAGSPNASLRRK